MYISIPRLIYVCFGTNKSKWELFKNMWLIHMFDSLQIEIVLLLFFAWVHSIVFYPKKVNITWKILKSKYYLKKY